MIKVYAHREIVEKFSVCDPNSTSSTRNLVSVFKIWSELIVYTYKIDTITLDIPGEIFVVL